MVSIDDLSEVVHWLFKQAITGPIKSKMAEIRHLGCQNAKKAIFWKTKQFSKL